MVNSMVRPATASMIFCMNPMSVPKLKLSDDALLERYREIHFSAILKEKRDPDFIKRIQRPDRGAAFFAMLVERIGNLDSLAKPPEMPDAVRNAVNARVVSERTEIDDLVDMIVDDPNGRIVLNPYNELWKAWCELHGKNGNNEDGRVGPYSKRGLTRAVTSRKRITIVDNGRAINGVRKYFPGVRLGTPRNE